MFVNPVLNERRTFVYSQNCRDSAEDTNYRYRIGSRLTGKWERYLELELTAPLVLLRFTEIHYGEARAEDVELFPDNRSIQIKLVYGPVAKWNWKVTAYPVTQKQS